MDLVATKLIVGTSFDPRKDPEHTLANVLTLPMKHSSERLVVEL
jgi:hypothetical protein